MSEETEKNELEEQQAKEVEQQEKLEEKTQEKMDKVFNDSTPEPEPESKSKSTPEPEPEPEPEPDPQKKKSEPEPEPEPEPKPADEDVEPGPKPAEDENALSQAEIRAALHNNWKQEDLDELVKENPGLAKRTCAKLLEGTNNLSEKFAELGRKAQKAAQKTTEKPEDEKPKPKIELKTIDIEKLRRDNDNDPLIDIVAEQQANQKILVDKFNELDSVSTSAVESEADTKAKKAEAAENAAISQQIDVFFGKPEVVGYQEFYGEVPKNSKDWDKLTGEQVGHRWEVVEQAEQILLGAEQQGMKMALDEAFERAHLIVTKEVSEQVVRDKIKSSVQKRKASFTLKPSSSKAATDSKGQKAGTQFETSVSARLKKVFN